MTRWRFGFSSSRPRLSKGSGEYPVIEITRGRLSQAMEAFRRLPFVEPGLSDAIAPTFGQQAMKLAQGPVRTWMHRTLEKITDERQLQRIILRLSQASLPLYAQVLHGPLEYGKDVVVYFEQHGRRVLRMYEVKAGDISLPVWQQTRSQLEEMFLVPLPDRTDQSPRSRNAMAFWCAMVTPCLTHFLLWRVGLTPAARSPQEL